MENFHEWLLAHGFACRRVFDQRLEQFRLEYEREFFDANIVVSPCPQMVPNDGVWIMPPKEQVDEFSDIEILKTHHCDEFSVYLRHNLNSVHLCVFSDLSDLIALFTLCRTELTTRQ